MAMVNPTGTGRCGLLVLFFFFFLPVPGFGVKEVICTMGHGCLGDQWDRGFHVQDCGVRRKT
jgi:hypothetical protein